MNRRLLFAEGDPDLCRRYEIFFDEFGYEVETASDGLDCLEKLRQATPAVLVLDSELRWGGAGRGAFLAARGRSHPWDSRHPHRLGGRPARFRRMHRAAHRLLPAQALRAARAARDDSLCRRRRTNGRSEHMARTCDVGTFYWLNRRRSRAPVRCTLDEALRTRTLTRRNFLPQVPPRYPTQTLEDFRLAERVARALRTTGYGALHGVEVSVSDRVVKLQGRVPSYYFKQIAQETALAIPGMHHVHNGLDVVQPSGRQQEICNMPQQRRKLMESPNGQSEAAGAKPTVRRPRNKPGVLVVDDDRWVRIMVKLGLERNGFDVWLAPNGREAIELYREHKKDIAVVLLDVCMLRLRTARRRWTPCENWIPTSWPVS